MSFKKTLGGDRLGSGKKMQVELHGYERSTHDKGYLWRSTMSPGTLVPFMKEIALPGDTFDIDLGCNIMTHPTVGPLFGSYKVQLDVFQAPIRLYNSLLHNNALGIGMNISGVKFPVLRLKATDVSGSSDIDNSQINPSSIAAYLGIRGIGVVDAEEPNKERDFNAIPYLAVAEIYKNYYANKQEGIGAVIHRGGSAISEVVTLVEGVESGGSGSTAEIPQAPAETNLLLMNNDSLIIAFSGVVAPSGDDIIFITNFGEISLNTFGVHTMTEPGYMYYSIKYTDILLKSWRYRIATDVYNGAPEVATFPLDDIDKMRTELLRHSSTVAPFVVTAQDLYPYKWIAEQPNDKPNLLNSQEGLFVKTYQSDLFNNWLDTEWIDGPTGVNAISSVDVSGGVLNLDTLNLAKKVYDMLNRIAVSGGTYNDWLDVQYGHERWRLVESPMYMGGLIKELVFQEVIANAASEGQDLGTLAGRGVMSGKHKGGQVTIKVDEPSYIIGLISLTPRVDYSQGNDWDINLKDMSNLHVPALDEIGFQELITEQMAWWDTKKDAGTWVQKSAGKQPAWLNYMTSVNKVLGNFAIPNNEMFMVLARRYEQGVDGHIKDLTTYIDPVKFNHIFADTAIDAQNFWAQISVDMTVRRKMSAKVMPNL